MRTIRIILAAGLALAVAALTLAPAQSAEPPVDDDVLDALDSDDLLDEIPTPEPVAVHPPQANFWMAVAGDDCDASTVQVNALASKPSFDLADGTPVTTITSYAWDFGDGATGSGAAASHTYGAAGDYDIELEITDGLGATSSITKTVTIEAVNSPPTAAFDYTLTGTSDGVEIELTDESTDPEGDIAERLWHFDDLETLSGPNPSRTYTEAGTYSVQLVVYDDCGLADHVTKEFVITEDDVETGGGDPVATPPATVTATPRFVG